MRVIVGLPVYDGVYARAGECYRGFSSSMRRFLIGLVVLLLLIASIGVGVTVARWPDLMLSWQPDRAR